MPLHGWLERVAIDLAGRALGVDGSRREGHEREAHEGGGARTDASCRASWPEGRIGGRVCP
jgi:hypothetical protein